MQKLITQIVIIEQDEIEGGRVITCRSGTNSFFVVVKYRF